MKRIGILMSFLLLLAAPTMAKIHSAPILAQTALRTELPWSTVQAVLKKVAEHGHYTFNQLVTWYDQGSLTVETCGSGYLATIEVDGIADIVLEGSI